MENYFSVFQSGLVNYWPTRFESGSNLRDPDRWASGLKYSVTYPIDGEPPVGEVPEDQKEHPVRVGGLQGCEYSVTYPINGEPPVGEVPEDE